MFYRFGFSDCFESEFQRIGPLVRIAWSEKDFLLLVTFKLLTCLVETCGSRTALSLHENESLDSCQNSSRGQKWMINSVWAWDERALDTVIVFWLLCIQFQKGIFPSRKEAVTYIFKDAFGDSLWVSMQWQDNQDGATTQIFRRKTWQSCASYRWPHITSGQKWCLWR